MRVAAVVPHWNRRDLLFPLFESIRAQTLPFDEIIVADNGSTDDSAELAERAGARVLRLGRNLGFAAAVNRGIEATRADWIATLNNQLAGDASGGRRTRRGMVRHRQDLASRGRYDSRRHVRRDLAGSLRLPVRGRKDRFSRMEQDVFHPICSHDRRSLSANAV